MYDYQHANVSDDANELIAIVKAFSSQFLIISHQQYRVVLRRFKPIVHFSSAMRRIS